VTPDRTGRHERQKGFTAERGRPFGLGVMGWHGPQGVLLGVLRVRGRARRCEGWTGSDVATRRGRVGSRGSERGREAMPEQFESAGLHADTVQSVPAADAHCSSLLCDHRSNAILENVAEIELHDEVRDWWPLSTRPSGPASRWSSIGSSNWVRRTGFVGSDAIVTRSR